MIAVRFADFLQRFESELVFGHYSSTQIYAVEGCAEPPAPAIAGTD